MTATVPQFLVLEVPDAVAVRTAFGPLADAIAAQGGTVLALAPPREVEVLEAGSRLAGVLIARWDARQGLEAFWSGAACRSAFAPIARVRGARAVSARGVPAAGLPGDFLPTIATVTAPRLPTPPAYMLVQGSVTDLEPIERYAGIIMPMLRERHGYYVVYAQAPDVTVLHGEWHEQAFIVSRWPTIEAARDFWWCDRYQLEAIPTRTGHGEFTVLLMPGIAG